jgi:serine/threonine protein kinase
VEYHKAFFQTYSKLTEYVCLVVEYCEGGDLQNLMDKYPKKILPEGDIITYMIQICEGLAYLHEKHIIHRDLKPKNIFVKQNLLKIGDFGFSKELGISSFQTGSVCGTVEYMSPEMFSRKPYNGK